MDVKDKEDIQASKASSLIKATSELIEKVPVYQDAIQPAAKEAGKALETVGKAVNAALVPLRGLVWGMEKIEEFVQTNVSEKLANIPPHNIQTPDPSVAGPVLESLRFTGHKESLSELYANLLATSMDKNTAQHAHPGFVEIIRNLSSDEARVFSFLLENKTQPVVDIYEAEKKGIARIPRYFYVCCIGSDANVDFQSMIGTYLRNLERLGLIDIPRDGHISAVDAYDRILNDPSVKKIEQEINRLESKQADFEKYYVSVSQLGRTFGAACIK